MKLCSPAKINLFLHVVGKRPDGYHDLFSLICPVGIFDAVSISFQGSEITTTCNDPLVPDDESNLAYRAAKGFLDQLGRSASAGFRGIRIAIEKQIPVGAGLGGGSGNAAAVLWGLNHSLGRPFNKKILLKIGLSIGADIPFFIFSRPALARGVGEKLKGYHGLHPYSAVILFPGFSVSTAEVFRSFNFGLTSCERKLNYTSFIKHKFDVKHHLWNDLEGVTASRHSEINEIKTALCEQGALGALMTGSGPSVFGLFKTRKKAEAAAAALKRQAGHKVFCCDLITRPIRFDTILPEGRFDNAWGVVKR
ncbi:MAG: 4-(cytidine 5'-diphospho)-2-C-methyl-D-erythritol kinase [Thermodesulfobacteriota bacterium]